MSGKTASSSKSVSKKGKKQEREPVSGNEEAAANAGSECCTVQQERGLHTGDERMAENQEDASEDKLKSEELERAEELAEKVEDDAEEETETSSVEDNEEEGSEPSSAAEEQSSGSGSDSISGEQVSGGAENARGKRPDEYRGAEQENSVFIKGFGNEVTESALRNELEKFGAVKGIRMPKDRNTGRSKGFAYVDFEEKGPVEKVLELKSILGMDVVTDRPRPMVARTKESPYTVFAKNLPYECDEGAVKEYFGRFGEVQEVRMPRDETGRPKGFAFIEVFGKEAYEKILRTCHVFDDRKLIVDECSKNRKSFGRGFEGRKPYGDAGKRFKSGGDRYFSESGDNFDNTKGGMRGYGRRGEKENGYDERDSRGGRFSRGADNGRKDERFGGRSGGYKDDFHRKKGSDGKKIVFDEDSD